MNWYWWNHFWRSYRFTKHKLDNIRSSSRLPLSAMLRSQWLFIVLVLNVLSISSNKLSDKSTYWYFSQKNVGYEPLYTEMSYPPKMFFSNHTHPWVLFHPGSFSTAYSDCGTNIGDRLDDFGIIQSCWWCSYNVKKCPERCAYHHLQVSGSKARGF